MRVQGLDGRLYPWLTTGHVVPPEDERERSSYHLRVRALLRQLYPSDRILEEVPLPGSGGLTCDFYLPLRKLMVEAQGQQHFRFIPHFHGDEANFRAALQRDQRKLEWAALNKIVLVRLPFDESDEHWTERLFSPGKAGEQGS